MSRAKEILYSFDLVEGINFKAKTLVNSLEKATKGVIKVEKGISKKYKELKYDIPSKDHPAYPEYKAAYDAMLKEREDAYKKYLPIIKKEIQGIKDEADPKSATEYIYVLRQVMKEIYDDIKENDGFKKSLSKVKDELHKLEDELYDISKGTAFIDKFKKDFEGKELSGVVTTVRKDQWFDQNNNLVIWFREKKSGNVFTILVDATDFPFEEGDKIKTKLKFHDTSPRSYEQPNVIRFQDFDSALLVLADYVKMG